jgi:peptide/nickel transport system substrate-binding protein
MFPPQIGQVSTPNQRVKRRTLLQAGIVAGAGLAGVACRPQRSATQTRAASTQGTTAKQPRRGGTLNYAGGEAGSYDNRGVPLDPNTNAQFGAKSFSLYYERLFGYDLQTYAVQPELIQKWEQPSPTEYLFTLQPNVKWQNKPPVNGRPLKVEDILYSLERARTNDPRFTSRSLLSFVDRVEAVDAQRVRITTKTPNASALTAFSVDNLAIFAQEALEKDAKLTTAESAIGTGAFILTSVEDKVGAQYVRNPDYWKPGEPYLDGVRTRYFADLQSAWSAFLAGQVDITQVPGPEAKGFLNRQPAGSPPAWYADDTLFAFMAPNTNQKPMNDARVTRALRLLTDHQEMISAWAEPQVGRGRHASIFPTALAAWDLKEDEYQTHLEWKGAKDDAAKEALSLLGAAGFTKDAPLKFELTVRSGGIIPTAAQLVQAQWKRLSQGIVDAQIRLLDSNALSAARANRSFQYLVTGHSAGMVDPDIWLTTTYRTGGSLNYAGISDPQLDAMIDKQRSMFDDTQRRAAVKDIILYMIDHAPTTIGADLYWLDATRPAVQGYQPENFLNGRQYQSIWLAS